MAHVCEDEPGTATPDGAPGPGLRPLAPVLGPQFALGPRHVAVCALFGAMFVYLNVLRLWYTDLWGHVAYGRWILAHHALPVFEPFMPLASGVRVINYCWLSQVIFALAERWGGAAALSNLFALAVLARYMIMARTCYVQTRRLELAIGGMLTGFVLSWVRNPVLRPEVFAALCFQICSGGSPPTTPAPGSAPTRNRRSRAGAWASGTACR